MNDASNKSPAAASAQGAGAGNGRSRNYGMFFAAVALILSILIPSMTMTAWLFDVQQDNIAQLREDNAENITRLESAIAENAKAIAEIREVLVRVEANQQLLIEEFRIMRGRQQEHAERLVRLESVLDIGKSGRPEGSQ